MRTSKNAVKTKFAANIPSANSGEHGLLPGPDRGLAADAEEAGPPPEGELAQLFRNLGDLSMGVARVLRPPRVRAPAPWVSIYPRRVVGVYAPCAPAGASLCPPGARGWLLRAF
jgi:hypothetical protein